MFHIEAGVVIALIVCVTLVKIVRIIVDRNKPTEPDLGDWYEHKEHMAELERKSKDA